MNKNSVLSGYVAAVLLVFTMMVLVSCVGADTMRREESLRGEEDVSEEGLKKPGNNYPVILVYGFMGFDSYSFVRWLYWGGAVDLEKELTELGYTVYTAKIGPVSSNHDRACELYAAIKGGRVDYGEQHSRNAGHSRYGRSYEGLYPQWGTEDPETGEVRKVHLVGHSMGGQTSRVLVHLLEHGIEEEEVESDSPSPLFAGDKNWVSSVTTFSTPHNGATIVFQYRDAGFIRRLYTKWLATTSVRMEDPFIDMQLEHWEVAKREDETFPEFLRRAVDEELWKDIEDFSYYDLSPKGSEELNGRMPASPHVYYFSWATSCTVMDPETGYHVPAKGMNLPLHSNARFLGSFEDLPDGVDGPASKWWENDGIVNTWSMDGPKIGSRDVIREFDGEPVRGVWNFMGTLHPYDHWQIHVVPPLVRTPPPGYDSLLELYKSLCEMLWSL
ncbi:MAG: esterase/lipase family protein [Spirochaetaceae bacterium]